MNLSELIGTHRGGRTYAELARDCGGSPSAERIRQLLNGPLKNFPDPPTVAALARGLRVSHSAVVLASAESLGLDVSTSMPRVVELLPAGARDLTEQQAAAIAHLVHTIVDASDQEAGDGDDRDAASMTEPTVGEVYQAWVTLLRPRRDAGEKLSDDDLERLEVAEKWLAKQGPLVVIQGEGGTSKRDQMGSFSGRAAWDDEDD